MPWLNVIEYPFPTREFRAREGWMSYVDIGRGRPVVFVHGSMSWSYIFRKMIRTLAPYHRCVAIDHLGFGLSEKPTRADYSHKAHYERLKALLDYLELEDVTLVVHDSGGPIGLPFALEFPDRVREVVLLNTFMWPLDENGPAQRISKLCGNPLNRIYYRVLNASPLFIFPALFADRHRMSRSTQMQYLEPWRSFKTRGAAYDMVSGLRSSRDWFDELWEKREVLADKRALLLWGLKDPLFGIHALDRWTNLFNNLEVTTFERNGRYLLEENPWPVVDELRWFLMNFQSALTERGPR